MNLEEYRRYKSEKISSPTLEEYRRYKANGLLKDKVDSTTDLPKDKPNLNINVKPVNIRDFSVISYGDLQKSVKAKQEEKQKEQERWNNLSLGEKVQEPFKNVYANATYGDLGEKENYAWNEYRQKQDEASRLKAEELTKRREEFEQNSPNVGKGNWITKDFAQYLPQLKNQVISGAKGAGAGALAGAGTGAGAALIAGQLGPQVVVPEELATVPAGALAGAGIGGKGGYVAGTAKYGYDVMAGNAYKRLLDMGVPNDVALEISNDEAVINSLIEGAGSVVDLITLGFGKIGTKGATTATKKLAQNRLMAAAKAYGVNLISEPLEEMAQEKVSIEAEKKAAEKSGIKRMSTESEDMRRIGEAGTGAFKIATVGGLGNAGGNIVSNAINNKINPAARTQALPVMDNITQNQLAEINKNIATQKRTPLATAEKATNNNIAMQPREPLTGNSPIISNQDIQKNIANNQVSKYTNVGGDNNGRNKLGGMLERDGESSGIYEENQPQQTKKYTRAEYEQFEKSVNPIAEERITDTEREVAQNYKNKYNKDIVFFDSKENSDYLGGASIVEPNKIFVDINSAETFGYNKIASHEVMESDILHNRELKEEFIKPIIQKIIDDPNFQQQKNEFWSEQSDEIPSDYLIAKDIICDRFAELENNELADYPNVLSQETNMTLDYGIKNFRDEIKNVKHSADTQSAFSMPENINPVTNLQEASRFVANSTEKDINTLQKMIDEAKKYPDRIDLQFFSEAAKRKLDDLINKYGTLKKGEKSVRDIDLPKQVSKSRYVSKHAQTLAEAGVTTEETVDLIKQMVEDGMLTHEVIADKSAKEYAENVIREQGFADAVKLWDTMVSKGLHIDKNDIALGQMIYNQAGQNKDVALVKKMIADLVNIASENARGLQASRLLKKLTPDGRLYSLEKSAMQINKEMLKRYGDKFKAIDIPDDLARNLLESKTQQETDTAVANIQQYIADNVPATFMDKVDAWRYLAMLGNPKTHIKNILGNAVFYPVRGLKNVVGTGIENLATESGWMEMSERTKSLKVDEAAKDFAKNDFEQIKDSVKGISKYDIGDAINDRRTIFNTKWLETARKGNSEFLDLEDEFFLKLIYTNSFAQAMNARGITTEYLQKGTAESNNALNDIRDYAIKEAQKGTYRNANSLAEYLNTWQRYATNKFKNADNLKGKIGWGMAHILNKGALPFVKVPINIAQMGIEYSPVSFASAIWKGSVNNFSKIESGKYTASEVIDDISKGLTGSALLGLGIILAKCGIITGAGEDKDKERGFEALQGNQNYAINLFGHSYTIDWAAPASLPFFVGVECVNSVDKDIFEKATTIVDPLFELSMLKGVGDIIKSAQYTNTNAVSAIGSTIAQNYMGQFIPSVIGQLARSTVSQRRTTYKDKNSWIPTSVQNFEQKQRAKIPILNHTLPKYVDQWGNIDKEENVVMRFFENFLSPGYVSKNKTTKTDSKLKELYEATQDISVLPSRASKSITVNKVKKELAADEYEKYATIRGQKSFEYVTDIINNNLYDTLSDTDKVKVIKNAYSYANEEAKEAISAYGLEGSDLKIKTSNKSPGEWLLLKAIADSGGDKKEEKEKSLISAGYTRKETEDFLTEYKGYKYGNNTLPTLKDRLNKLPTLKK